MRFLGMPSCSSHPDTRFRFGSHTLQKRGWAYSWKLPKGQGIFRISEHIILYMFESSLNETHPHSLTQCNVPSQGRTKVARNVDLRSKQKIRLSASTLMSFSHRVSAIWIQLILILIWTLLSQNWQQKESIRYLYPWRPCTNKMILIKIYWRPANLSC